MSLNKVMLIGNAGQDPEVRYLEGGTSNTKVATFRLATTDRYRDLNSGQTREQTEWHNIVAWRNAADIVEKYVRKGTQLYIEGRLRTRSWDDQNGNKRYTTEVIADSLQLLGRKADNPASQDNVSAGAQQYGQPSAPVRTQSRPAQVPDRTASAAPQVQAGPAAEDDDDLPF